MQNAKNSFFFDKIVLFFIIFARMRKNTKKEKLTAAHIWAMFAETDRKFAKTDRKFDRIEEQLGGLSNNMGYHAEQFFQGVFEEKLEFGGMKYDEMIPNLTYIDKGVKIEFDIALLNGDSIALIEVKNRIHPDFVDELAEERIENFRKFFPKYKDYRAYLGIAGFSFSDEVLERAGRYGIGIVKQVGEGVEIKADNLRMY